MKIAIITTMPFPSGEASVNRIMSYSKGLAELGENVTVFSTNVGNIEYQNIDGYRYKSLRRKYANPLLDKISLFLALLSLLRKICVQSKCFDRLILISNSFVLILPLYLICKIKNIPFLREKSEFPFNLKTNSSVKLFFARIYNKFIFRLCDGLIIMTNPLNDYFADKVKKSCRRIVMPMTVDNTRFQNVEVKNIYGDYIAYCGDIGGNKDGVESLINSFSLIEDDCPDLTLLLIGDSKEIDAFENLKKLVERLSVKNIVFTGRVDRDIIPELLCNAKVLVLARPNSLQSAGGFPTKLGEYLSTGNPVLVTAVGEIPFYLKDNENAFLVEPDNNRAFAEKLFFILNNYEMAKEVAKKGQKLSETTFNYKYQSKRLQEFLINEFNEKRS